MRLSWSELPRDEPLTYEERSKRLQSIQHLEIDPIHATKLIEELLDHDSDCAQSVYDALHGAYWVLLAQFPKSSVRYALWHGVFAKASALLTARSEFMLAHRAYVLADLTSQAMKIMRERE
jgi:hypothetical protein|nr:hypothetical protein [Neorhizobium tomejilense]